MKKLIKSKLFRKFTMLGILFVGLVLVSSNTLVTKQVGAAQTSPICCSFCYELMEHCETLPEPNRINCEWRAYRCLTHCNGSC